MTSTMMVLSFIKNFLFTTTITILVLMFAPGLPPHEAEFESVPVEPHIPLTGNLAVNDKLNKAELISDDVEGSNLGFIKGAESFTFRDGYLYTGIQGGDIVRLDTNKDVSKGVWQTVAKLGTKCQDEDDEVNCGRPLGMAFDRWGFLLVCDPYYGLVRVDVETGKTMTMVSPQLMVDGKRNTFTNSVAISKKGKGNIVYFTSSSSHFHFLEGMYEAFSKGSGRLLRHDTAANTTEVLLNDLKFANGLALSKDEEFLVVNESGRDRIWKYYLEGPKQGQREIFAKTPGVCDNIKSNGKGGFLVGIIALNDPNDKVKFAYIVKSHDFLSRFVVRLLRLSQIMFEFLDAIVPNDSFKMLVHHLSSPEYSVMRFVPPYGLILELNEKGEVTKSWHSPDGSLSRLSEGYLHTDGYIYLGSPYNKYIARVKYD